MSLYRMPISVCSDTLKIPPFLTPMEQTEIEVSLFLACSNKNGYLPQFVPVCSGVRTNYAKGSLLVCPYYL